jgi:hypothetical protein
MASYGAISARPDEDVPRMSAQTGHARNIFIGLSFIALMTVIAVAMLTARDSQTVLVEQRLASVSIPEEAVQYVRLPANAAEQAVQYASLPAQPDSESKKANEPVARALMIRDQCDGQDCRRRSQLAKPKHQN